ncbi:replication protein A 70 kDa DNA-binding subunit [Tribolium castaneum]|uniref:Replication protein A subunit n=1 Tax=Tribolium castaneum TaxID=7070 RepID=D6WZF7_TRICA|nr:PREDICTED: replication protein A 70 kDa DNA-binding subunit [Tribolium castaneum]EFA09711.2 Replication protein A 70 kDa DNA-binding subunit-like Protein [Tribolium castaneum]|eukprot:XP_970077.2 PREDICTED: replication protein A 70 kDa DNA-binding subunit [Tribolium castaneum]
MASAYKLSEGALQTIMYGGEVIDPLVQILGTKKMSPGGSDSSSRLRLMISDGLHKVNIAVFTVPKNDQTLPHVLEQVFTIIKLKRYLSNVIKNKNNIDARVIAILELEVVARGEFVGQIIGNPVSLSDSETLTQSSDVIKRNECINGSFSSKTISPIASLNPFHNNWIIRARVVNKTNVRNWSNAKGEGKLFSIDLVDKGGEIRCTAFRDLVDKFFDRLEVDKVYYISKCQLQPINRQFCSLKHQFEMYFTPETIIEPSYDDNEIIPQITYNFTTIDKVAVMEAGTIVDVIGVCKTISELQSFVAKSTNREMQKRQLVLVDQTKTAISLNLWGSQAESFAVTGNPVILVKNAKIYEFRGAKSITLMGTSLLKIDPEIRETHILRRWYHSEGNQVEITNVSHRNGYGSTPWLTFKEARQQTISEKPLYYQTFGTILLVRLDRAVYKSCPNADCQKKVLDLENGMYRCEKCNREFPNFKYRLLVSMNVADSSSSQWVTVFSSEAEKILGKTAQEIGELMETDPDTVANMFEEAQFKQFIFKCRAKIETYNDEQKMKTVVVTVAPVDYEEYNAYLVDRIEKFTGVPCN